MATPYAPLNHQLHQRFKTSGINDSGMSAADADDKTSWRSMSHYFRKNRQAPRAARIHRDSESVSHFPSGCIRSWSAASSSASY